MSLLGLLRHLQFRECHTFRHIGSIFSELRGLLGDVLLCRLACLSLCAFILLECFSLLRCLLEIFLQLVELLLLLTTLR